MLCRVLRQLRASQVGNQKQKRPCFEKKKMCPSTFTFSKGLVLGVASILAQSSTACVGGSGRGKDSELL